MTEIFEILMLICFAASWPFNIAASLKAKTAVGKSILFELAIEAGYICGMINKIINDSVNYVMFFYILGFALVFIDILLYFRNRRLDAVLGVTDNS